MAKNKLKNICYGELVEYSPCYKLYGGRSLLDVLGVSTNAEAITWLNTNKNNPSAWAEKGIMVGDYLDITLSCLDTGYQDQRIAIAQCDKDGYYYSNYEPCLWFTFVNCIALKQHHTTNTNTGGYPASDIRTWLNDTVYNTLVALGFSIRTAKIGEALAATEAWGTGSEWQDEKVFLPCETQVFGHSVLSGKQTCGAAFTAGAYQPRILDYYRLNPSMTKKYYGSENKWWWLQDPAYAYTPDRAVAFCRVNASGLASSDLASASYGVSPLFIL